MSAAKSTRRRESSRRREYIPPPLPPGVVKALRVFKAHFPELLKKHPGEWVACASDQFLFVGRSWDKIYQRCLKLGLKEEEFIVLMSSSRRDRVHRLIHQPVALPCRSTSPAFHSSRKNASSYSVGSKSLSHLPASRLGSIGSLGRCNSPRGDHLSCRVGYGKQPLVPDSSDPLPRLDAARSRLFRDETYCPRSGP